MNDDVRQPLNRLAQDIENDAKANAPVHSGKLKHSIEAKAFYKNDDDFGVNIKELSYGQYVEGHRYMKDAIKKGLDKNLPKITEALTNSVLKNILK